jgi:mRNA interferase MazF
LEAFDALPAEEKRVFTAEFLRKTFPSIPVRSTIKRRRMRPIVSSRCLTRRRMTPVRGEVWLLDLGMVENVRPALIVSAGFSDFDRALITVVPHITSLRGSHFEVVVPVPFLKPGAFLVQTLPRLQPFGQSEGWVY